MRAGTSQTRVERDGVVRVASRDPNSGLFLIPSLYPTRDKGSRTNGEENAGVHEAACCKWWAKASASEIEAGAPRTERMERNGPKRVSFEFGLRYG